MNKDTLYQWLFHYNHYSEKWSAFKREDYVKFFNGDPSIAYLVSDDINKLAAIIKEADGDITKLKTD